VTLRSTLLATALVALGTHGPIPTDQARPSSTVVGPDERVAIERAGGALIDALNTGRSDDWVALHAEATRTAVGTEKLVGQFNRVREVVGTLEFHHAELAEFTMGAQRSRVLHVYARAVSQSRWKDFQITIEPTPPYRFDQLAFIADVAEPVYLPNADLPDPNTKRWLESYIDRLVAKEGLSGSVLVTGRSGTVFARTFGYTDAAATQPITADTRFSMASASKMFTAALVARLVESGRLSYGETIARFFPGPSSPQAWAQVTIDQLLSHRSGIGEYWTEEFTRARASVRTLDQYLPWIHRAGQTFSPGTSHRYSNSNFILLGLIVERITGRSFEEELRRSLLQPLEMTSTSLSADGQPAGRDAQPLSRDGAGWRHSGLPPWGSSAGGAMTTVGDATAFLRALASGKVVTPATLATMTTVRNEGAEAFPYGYGFEMRRDGGAPSYGHGGIAAGVNAEVRYFPTLDVTLVLFSNQDNGAYDDLKKNLVKLITGAR
jgi:CubicO group peptidase (beta-lactamase class C family)